MTLTAIESVLFGGNTAHFVTCFDHSSAEITVRLEPVEPDERRAVVARFGDARLTDEWRDAGEELDWPLDIIGFDSYQQPDGRWRFVLNCDVIEWCWESRWPDVEVVVAGRS